MTATRHGGEALARTPGSCGELVQGSLAGVDVLVTCPIDRYAEARARLLPLDARVRPGADLRRSHPKVWRAVHAYLRRTGAERQAIRLDLASSLPRGKGMGSSTADICSALAALAACCRQELSPRDLLAACLSVEPSDGTMLPGIAVVDHRWGRLHGTLGEPPPLDVLVFDSGGRIDTLAFNAHPDLPRWNEAKEPMVREALELVRQGMALARAGRRGAAELIGAGATLSALAHQRILYKERLGEVLRLAREVGAVGVNVAHSGTVIGVLLDPTESSAAEVRPYLEARLGGALWRARLVGGGTQVFQQAGDGRAEGCR